MTQLSTYWATDKDLFASLPGGRTLIEWFGFCPTFHDATLERVELTSGKVSLVIRAFRMTTEIDAEGHYVLDRHVFVTLQMRGVTGLKLSGDAGSIVSELTIRQPGCVKTLVGLES
jgi:hypothetical protein